MAYDEQLAARIRELLQDRPDFSERQMFGGLCFMLGGHMCCGVVKRELMVRVGPEQYPEALKRPHARPMDFTGRPLEGMVYVGHTGLGSRASLAAWVERGAAFAASLPPKKATRPRPRKPRRPPSGKRRA